MKGKKRNFCFDHVFPETTTQSKIFNSIGTDTVNNLFEGYNGTIFAYGQTGAGKTFTMQGKEYSNDNKSQGIIPRLVEAIFSRINEETNLKVSVEVSYVEIYLEKIKDLLNCELNNLKIREDRKSGKGIFIDGVTSIPCSSSSEIFEIMEKGTANRSVATTKMNSVSSRSHSVFIIRMITKNPKKGITKKSKLFLVDLAGSETTKKSGARGTILEQAKNINKSLSALGNVINALTDAKIHHVPYRNSKLTRLLQDSLGGNSKTTMIINCSPSSFNQQETISTLRFGERAKSIQNKVKINSELDLNTLKSLLAEARKTIKNQNAYITYLNHLLKSAGIEFSDYERYLASGFNTEIIVKKNKCCIIL